MTTSRISESEISDLLVSSLPARPTAPAAFGGRGYTSAQMKAAFDRLPLFIVDRFNALMDDIESTGSNSLAAQIHTGIEYDHTLADLFSDITSGTFASYLSVFNRPLVTQIAEILAAIDDLKTQVASIADAASARDESQGG